MSVLGLADSPMIQQYKKVMASCMRLYYPDINDRDMNDILDYSISKRYQSNNVTIDNSYTKKKVDMTLLQVADYIRSRQPIVTGFGTMFAQRETVPNPLAAVVDSFLTTRSVHKKQMIQYPRGSEMFEKYNLLQSLDKIDTNGIYGTIGMYTSLLYNSNVATSITSQGRSLVSSMTLCFEQFLANNVKFGSLNEVMQFIDHIVTEKRERHYYDRDILDRNIGIDECFAKIVLTCGYRWIPDDKELDIIYKSICRLSQEDINRIYYKNNLYEFVSNSKIIGLVKKILHTLKRPLFNSIDMPPEIQEDINLLCDLFMEFVYYRYLYIDRTDRCDNMIKSVTMVSDTDSTIISLDAWYRFIVEQVNGEELSIANYCPNPITFMKLDENGFPTDKEWMETITFEPKPLDYNFETDEIVEREHINHPDQLTPNDNVRFSIINILAFCLDRIVNDYMEKFCFNNYSLKLMEDDYTKTRNPYIGPRYTMDNIPKEEVLKEHSTDHGCRILAKNEFTFTRLLMTKVKKNYASLIAVQEGHMVPEDKQLDIKGIECLTKSTKSPETRAALQKILLEDILRTPVIDQLKFVKDMAIFEKQIVNSIRAKSKEYYKPATIKSASTYSDPMRIQGVKGAVAWNLIRTKDLEAINLNERNAVNIAKVIINKSNIDIIKDKYPEIYENMKHALEDENFKDGISAISIPLDTEVPDWLMDFIDYTALVEANIGGFPYESIGVMRMDKKNVNYTNIVSL